MLRILGRVTSINVRKVVWVADELGLAYEQEEWGKSVGRDTRSPEFLALNPNGQVPVMVDDGFVLWESTAIIRYLAEVHGDGRLIPGAARDRALMEQWLGWQQAELRPVWTYAFRALGAPLPGFTDRQQIIGSIRRWTEKMVILERQLATGGPHIVGDAFTLADIALGVSVHRWRQTPFAKLPLPATDAYFDRLLQRPAARLALGDEMP